MSEIIKKGTVQRMKNMKYGKWTDMYNGTAANILFRGRGITVMENNGQVDGLFKYIARGNGLKYSRTPLNAISIVGAKLEAVELLKRAIIIESANNLVAMDQILEFQKNNDCVGGQ